MNTLRQSVMTISKSVQFNFLHLIVQINIFKGSLKSEIPNVFACPSLFSPSQLDFHQSTGKSYSKYVFHKILIPRNVKDFNKISLGNAGLNENKIFLYSKRKEERKELLRPQVIGEIPPMPREVDAVKKFEDIGFSSWMFFCSLFLNVFFCFLSMTFIIFTGKATEYRLPFIDVA